ncbi:lipase/acyltransferase domain-containing protein [Planctellipticum variicoloris]|uniref:lipase/acyltransferase domain-containing protein n=1 Tax=Planctellipticum variicoloris TaxID=3064265 RepID=UPI003013B38D|nr:hypothetical protein SH412_000569 [Planctomycetaceae bacterium SH412]
MSHTLCRRRTPPVRRWIVVVFALLAAGCKLDGDHETPSQSAGESLTRAVDSVRKAADSVRLVSNEVRGTGGPDLGSLYNRTARADDRDRNPIVVIPGILGSRLVDDRTGEVAWGEFGSSGPIPGTAASVQALGLPMAAGRPLSTLSDDVREDGVLSELAVKAFGQSLHVSAYGDILKALGVGGYRDPNGHTGPVEYDDGTHNCFEFGYDWRRDNAENAARLHAFLLEKRKLLEEQEIRKHGSLSHPVRFDIVAHSMGGLIARYHLMYGPAQLPLEGTPPSITWKGAELVERLVIIGTPSAGAGSAVKQLAEGVQYAKFLPKYEPALLGTMPAVYQLLPRTRHQPVVDATTGAAVDLFDPAVWRKLKWGLASPDQSRVLEQLLPEVRDASVRQQLADEHLTKCLRQAELFHAALDEPATPPPGVTLHLIAGDAHPTLARFTVDAAGKLTVTEESPGDGTVTRSSALMDERLSQRSTWTPRLVSPVAWSSVNFLFTDHLGLTADPAFTDNVLYLLLEAPRNR